MCNSIASTIVSDITRQAAAVGARLLVAPAQSACNAGLVKVCMTFFSDADGARLQPFVDVQKDFWLQLVTGTEDCPAFLYGYDVVVTVGADGSPATPPPSCLTGRTSRACRPASVDFPKCECVTRPLATPFAARPQMSVMPGRNGNNLYCFNIAIVTPQGNSACAAATTMLKAEIYADDNQRRKATGIALQLGGSSEIKYLSTTWGAVGEQTLKATPLNWSVDQARDAKICIELMPDTSIETFCMTGKRTCWINFFDIAKDCCPLYSASL